MQISDLSKFGSIWQQTLMVLYADRQAYYVFYHVALHSTFAFLAVCLSFFMCYLAQFLVQLKKSAFIFPLNTEGIKKTT